MEVYLDLVILLNFFVDFLLILGTNRLSGYPLCCKRAVLAAVVGGVYAGACLLPGFTFLGNLFWRLISLGLMSIIAFGCEQSALKRGVLFVFLSMALGGVAVGLGNGGFWSLVLSAAAVSCMCLLGFRGKAGQAQYVPITICHGGQSMTLTALVDTGNTLRDPISGRSVLVVDAQVGQKLLPLTAEQFAKPIETIANCAVPGLRLIPYSAVGCPGGMLLGIKVDGLRINGKESDHMVAFAPQRLGQGNYQALAGGTL